jgi:predicted Zn-dependent peptidase
MPDPRTPIVFVDVWYHVGSGDEVVGKSGFAHLFEHMMFQGTKNTGSDRHFNILTEIGASNVNGSTNTNRTNYFEQIPSNQLETALWLESERMGYLLDNLTADSLKNQIDVVRNERRQNYDNVPYMPSMLRMFQEMFPEGHPYRFQTIGRHEDLEAASVDDVKGFFRKWYVPSNATLLIAGDFDPATAKQLVTKWFGGFPRLARPAPVKTPMPRLSQSKRVVMTDKLAKLTRVSIGWHTPASFAPGDAELDILANALAAEGTGRLYKTLVLDKKLARRVVAYQQSMQQSSIFVVQVDLVPGADAAEAERLVLAEIASAQRTPIDAREFDRAVINFEAMAIYGLESLQARAEELQRCNDTTGSPDCLTRDLDRYRHSSPQAVLATARQYLSAPHVTIVTTPDAAVVKGDK